MKTRTRLPLRLYVLLALTGLLILSLWPLLVAVMPLTAKHHLERAWRQAAEVGHFKYRTDVVQTIHPTNRLENAGRSATTQHLFVEGMVDRPTKTMEITLGGQGVGARGLEMRVEDGQAFGRLDATGEWVEISNPTDIFAPGGDPLGFLVAADNVQEISGGAEELGSGGEKNSPLPSRSPAPLPGYTGYSFNINAVRYADYMRAQLEAAMRQRGELPAGINLGLVRQYVEMEGRGEIWVDDAGLPVHQVIHLEFPPERGAFHWTEADISTDFRGWDAKQGSRGALRLLSGQAGEQGRVILARLWQNPQQFLTDPLSFFSTVPAWLPTPENLQTFGLLLGLSLIITALAVAAVTHRRSLKFYGLVATVVLITMLLTPMLQSNRVQAFAMRQQERQAEAEAERESVQASQEAQAELSGRNFNPTVNPLADSGPPPNPLPEGLSLPISGGGKIAGIGLGFRQKFRQAPDVHPSFGFADQQPPSNSPQRAYRYT